MEYKSLFAACKEGFFHLMTIMKQPEECLNMQDIRTEIDAIDRQVIQLLGKRFDYVKAAAPFKTSETGVKAPERFKTMLLQRREWAVAAGLSPEAIEKMYFDLVTHFIEEELKHWKNYSSERQNAD